MIDSRFTRKIQDVVLDWNKNESLITQMRIDEQAEALLKHHTIESFVFMAPRVESHDPIYCGAVAILLASRYGARMVSAAEFNDSHAMLHNAFIFYFDGAPIAGHKSRVAEFMRGSVHLNENLMAISKSCQKNPGQLVMATWPHVANPMLPYLIHANQSVKDLVRSMTWIQLHACVKTLIEMGHATLRSEDLPECPKYPLQLENNGHPAIAGFRVIYDFFCKFMSPWDAQKKIYLGDDSSANMIFLGVGDLPESLRANPAAFVEMAMESKEGLYVNHLKIAIAALRNSGQIDQLDGMSKRHITSLYKQKLINENDLKVMPGAMRNLLLLKARDDFGL